MLSLCWGDGRVVIIVMVGEAVVEVVVVSGSSSCAGAGVGHADGLKCYDFTVSICLWLLSARHSFYLPHTLWLLCARVY